MATISQQLSSSSESSVSAPSRTQQLYSQYQNQTQTEEYNRNKAQAESLKQTVFNPENPNFSLSYYKTEYSKLPANLKPFFVTPEDLSKDASFQTYEQQTAEYNALLKKQTDYQTGIDIAKKGFTPFGMNKDVRQGYKDYIQRKSYAEEDYKQGMEIAKKGFVPFGMDKYVKLGYKDYIQRKSYAEERASYFGEIEARKRIFGEGGTFTEFNVVKGKDVPVKTTYYTKGVGYTFDLSGLPAGEKPIFSVGRNLDKETIVRISSIKSEAFGKTYNIEDYKRAVLEYQEKTSPENLKKQAGEYLSGFSKDVQNAPAYNPSLWEKTLNAVEIVALSSPFGLNIPLKESEVKKVTQARELRDGGAVSMILQGAGIFVPFAKRDIPYEALTKTKEADYKANQDIELFTKLDEITQKAPKEIQYYVQEGGLDILGKAGIKTGQNAKGEIFLDTAHLPEFERRMSQNAYELENAPKGKTISITPPLQMTNIDSLSGYKNPYSQNITLPSRSQTILLIRAGSIKAVESYFTGRALSYIAGGVISGSKNIYTSLGGGATIGSATIRGGVVSAELLYSTKALSPVVKNIVTGGLVTGFTGLYTYGQVQKYGSLTSQYGDTGKKLFYAELGGELTGVGLLIGSQLYTRNQIKQNNQLIKEQNQLKEDLKRQYENLKKYGAYSEKTSTGYKQAGEGKPVNLNDKQIDALSNEYAKVTGVSKEDAQTIIKEKSFYRTTTSTQDSLIPSTKRAIKSYDTGIATTGDDILQNKRFGFTDTIETDKGAKELAFEFSYNKGKVSNVRLITTVKQDEFAISSVFEKVKTSKLDPESSLRLKETILTKMEDLKIDTLGNKKISYFKTSNKLLNLYPYGEDKLTLQEAKGLGFGNEKSLANFDKLWNKADTGVSEVLNIRTTKPITYSNGIIQSQIEGEYKFTQSGLGKRALNIKNIIANLGDDYFKGDVITQRALSGTVPKQVPISDMLSKPISQPITDNVLKNEIKTTLSLKSMSVAPSIASFDNAPEITLKTLLSQKTDLASVYAFGSDLNLGQRSQQQLKNMLRVDLGLKTTDLTFEQPRIDTSPKTNTATATALGLGLGSGMASPRISTPSFSFPTPPNVNPPSFRMPDITTPEGFGGWGFPEPTKKRRLKDKLRQRKITELGNLPDFTTRILGLESQEFNMGDVSKVVNRISTGFEIRSGARLKGFKMPKEIKWQ